MINSFLEMFSYGFMVKAIIVGLLVSLCSALLGVSLVLKRYSMIGTGLSNVGFGSLAIATVLGISPLALSMPVVIIAAFFLLRLNSNSKIKGDSAIALVSTSALAIGVIVISLSTGMNTDVCNYMFGSILSLTGSDVYLSIGLSVAVIILFVLFYHRLFAVTFDEGFTKATGTKAGVYNSLLAILTAVTIVLGMRMMGALLISSLIIFPALTSMRLCKSFKSVIICSSIVSLVCFFVGVFLSFHLSDIYALPTGATIVAVNLAVFLVFSFISLVKRKIILASKRKKQELNA